MVGEISSSLRNTSQVKPFLYCGKLNKTKWYESCTDAGQRHLRLSSNLENSPLGWEEAYENIVGR